MLCELKRGHDAFAEPAVGFTVTKLTGTDNFFNVSSMVPADTCVVVAIRNMGSTHVTVSWSFSNTIYDDMEWTQVNLSPARPIPALGGHYALPCNGTAGYEPDNINAVCYHNLWLHIRHDSRYAECNFELLTCSRDHLDKSVMYSNKQTGVAVPGNTQWRWQSGMMIIIELSPCHWRSQDRELIRKAKWASSHRTHEDAGIVGKDLLLAPNRTTVENPATHWLTLRTFGSLLLRTPANDQNEISAKFRADWNASFARFGADWLMNPYADMSMDDCREHCLLRARSNDWWVATDLTAVLEHQATLRLQKAIRVCLSDPEYCICRRRLQYECFEMQSTF